MRHRHAGTSTGSLRLALSLALIACSGTGPPAGPSPDGPPPDGPRADGPSPDAMPADAPGPGDAAPGDAHHDAAPPPAPGPYLTGWWIDVNRPEMLATFASEGATLVLGTSAWWFVRTQMTVVTDFLDEADRLGIQVILGMNHGGSPYDMSEADFTTAISALRGHPALHAWYLADEPELGSFDHHGYLATSPGYSGLARAADPDHPVFISFNMAYDDAGWDAVRAWYDAIDLLGMHNYPFYSSNAEFGGGSARRQYDKWSQLQADARAYGLQGPVATCQGFGDGTVAPYRTPTLRELRYQVFSAVVLGIDRVLFWMYNGWGDQDPVAVARVGQMVGEIRSVEAEMLAGVTRDPAVTVSRSEDEIVYRHGAAEGRHVILAVNIANRDVAGATLADVQFTLPAGVQASSVEVLHESRSLPVTGGTFSDSFAPFEVHLYRFVAAP